MPGTRDSIELVARGEYGRLVAALASRTGNLASAEDALGDALLAALEAWPASGVPDNPAAWLMSVARRRDIDRIRRQATASAHEAELIRAYEEIDMTMSLESDAPDPRLGLLFACAHPAVDPAARTPLMLQAVLGLSAERMAPAFVCAPATLTKRLTRAKRKIAESGVPFSVPEPELAAERLGHVLDAIYGAFTLSRGEEAGTELESEAIWLSGLLIQLMPQQAEAKGLLALMLHVVARRPARDPARYVPLSEQDAGAWDRALIERADAILASAAALDDPGRFQLEAAIQSIHSSRTRGFEVDWEAIAALYRNLLVIAPRIGAHVGYAAALAHGGRAAEGLSVLDDLETEFGDRVADHQPYWATRAHLLALCGEPQEAADAYHRAAGLAADASLRDWLLKRRAELAN